MHYSTLIWKSSCRISVFANGKENIRTVKKNLKLLMKTLNFLKCSERQFRIIALHAGELGVLFIWGFRSFSKSHAKLLATVSQ